MQVYMLTCMLHAGVAGFSLRQVYDLAVPPGRPILGKRSPRTVYPRKYGPEGPSVRRTEGPLPG